MMLNAALVLAMVAFFPSRPAHARVYIANGTLASYGVGNAEGHLELRDDAGRTIGFYVGYPMHINGKIVICGVGAPCPQWPATLVVGKSRVSVRYWAAMHEGRRVRIADALTNAR